MLAQKNIAFLLLLKLLSAEILFKTTDYFAARD